MNRKLLSVFMSVALLFASFGMAFATEAVTTSAASDFSDMPDNWSTAALNKAVENDLLTGYAESGKKLIKAGNFLTRAEMATVVNRVFASEKMSDLSKVSDVSSSAWYAKDMAKAVKMGTFSYDRKMRPGDNITRQEAFTVLARAFKLVGTDANHKALNAFSDKDEIATWALDSLDGMAAAGYIQGSGGVVKPTANITRAEFATVMDNLVKDYIDLAGDVTEVAAAGNVIVRVAGVTLKDVTVKGDLIIADGVGDGDVTLDNVKVEGRTLVRGGGENSIIIKGGSELGRVIVAKVDGVVRVFAESGAEVEVIYVDDGSDDVTVEGKFGNLEVAGEGVTVYAKEADVNNATVSGNNSKIVVGDGSKVKSGSITGESSAIIVDEGGSVDTVTVSGNNATVGGDGEVKEVEVKDGVEGTEVGGKPIEGGQKVDGSGEAVTPPSRPSTPVTPPEPGTFTATFNITVVNEEGNFVSADATIKVEKVLWDEWDGNGEPERVEQDAQGDGTYKLEIESNYQYTITKEDGFCTVEGPLMGPEDIVVELTLVKLTGPSYNSYTKGDTLEFTIGGFESNKEVWLGLPIGVDGRYGDNDEPDDRFHRFVRWASNQPVLTTNMKCATTDMKYGINGLYWVGMTDANGELKVSGIVGDHLPYGGLAFTLPEYGIVIDNAIGVVGDGGSRVTVGEDTNELEQALTLIFHDQAHDGANKTVTQGAIFTIEMVLTSNYYVEKGLSNIVSLEKVGGGIVTFGAIFSSIELKTVEEKVAEGELFTNYEIIDKTESDHDVKLSENEYEYELSPYNPRHPNLYTPKLTIITATVDDNAVAGEYTLTFTTKDKKDTSIIVNKTFILTVQGQK